MNRLSRSILKNFWGIPGFMMKLSAFSKKTEKHTGKEQTEFIRSVCKRLQKSSDVSVEVSGKENIPAEGGFIFYPNHQGIFDGFALMEAIERPFSPVIKAELMSYPVIRQIFMCMDAMPMHREDFRQSMTVLQEVKRRVEEGKVCLIFPEGTRSKKNNQLSEFKPGSFKPAVKAHCPIVPIVLKDSFKPYDAVQNGHVTVYVHILKPLLWKDYQGMTTVEIAQAVKEKIAVSLNSHIMQCNY